MSYVQKLRPLCFIDHVFNPLDSKGNYSTVSNNMKLVHWPLMGGLLHLIQRGGAWAGCGPAQSPPRCTKCNSPPISGQCTNHILLYDGPLLCGFNVAIKGLKHDPIFMLSVRLTSSSSRMRDINHRPNWSVTN